MSQIHQLIENSKVNESIARKLFEIETEVLACQSSEELLERLLGLIQTKFQLSGTVSYTHLTLPTICSV